jgi:hypothetical protein
LRKAEVDLERMKTSLMSSKIQMESFKNSKYDAIIADLDDRLQVIEDKLQILRENHFYVKEKSSVVNKFTAEGEITCFRLFLFIVTLLCLEIKGSIHAWYKTFVEDP